MSEIEKPEFKDKEAREIKAKHVEITNSILSQQDKVREWTKENINTPYESKRKAILDRLPRAIPYGIDFDGVEIMMDFFRTEEKNDSTFKALAKEIGLVNICQPLYRYMYENWEDEEKERATWNFVQDRLLTGNNLEKAVSMHLGGILFGLDEQGNPMFADGGVEAIMTGLNYRNSREAVMKKGYTLFPCHQIFEKSTEVLKFEKFTREPFVRSEDGECYRASWLESGENPESFNFVYFSAPYQWSIMNINFLSHGDVYRGARSLFRAKK